MTVYYTHPGLEKIIQGIKVYSNAECISPVQSFDYHLESQKSSESRQIYPTLLKTVSLDNAIREFSLA